MLGFGALGEFPLADFGTPPPPVSISLPTISIAFAGVIPAGRFGKNIGAPTVSITFGAPLPKALPGKLIGLPLAPVTFGIPAPRASFGRLVGLPVTSLSFAALTPNLQTGRVIDLSNTFTVTTEIGSLGEGALGEFVMGDGEALDATYVRPINLFLRLPEPKLRPGKNENLPPVSLSLVAPRPEADARLRSIRINAIAS